MDDCYILTTIAWWSILYSG